MATASDASTKEGDIELVDIGECSLCNGKLKTPKLLPCQHSFCTPCLKTHISETQTTSFLCPTCNLKVSLSSGGVDSLPENYLYKIFAAKETIPKKRVCLNCELQGKTNSVTIQCLDCEDAFCNQCQAFHKISSASRHHRLVPIEELETDTYRQIQQEKEHFYCKKHSEGTRQYLLKAYCTKCGILHCEKCMLDEEIHLLFSKDKWECLKKEKLEIIDNEKDSLLNNLKEQRKIVGVIKNVEERLHGKKTALENQIYDKATEIQEEVEKVKNEKLQLVGEHFERELQNVKVLLEEEGNRLKRLEFTSSFVEGFVKCSSVGEYLMYEDDVKTRMAEYVEKRKKFEMKTEDLCLTGKPAVELNMDLNKVIGSFNSTSKCIDITGIERVIKFDPTVKSKIKLKVKAHGIAIAESGDIIVAGGSKIEILSKEGESKKMIQCKKLKNAWSVAVYNDLIFIADSESLSKQVIVYDLDGNLKNTIRMPDSEQDYPSYQGFGVTVNGETIYICLESTSAIYTCTLENYEAELKLFTSKKQQPSLHEPRNLILTTQGHLVVSMHNNKNIQVYGDKAELLWTFTNDNTCFGLCCDTEGHIFIGGYTVNKIHVVKDGTLKGVINIPGVSCIRGLTLSQDGDLLVTHNTNEITTVSVWG